MRATPPDAAPTLLVLRHHGLGDLVTVQPALRALRRRYPGHRLLTTCPSWLTPLARHCGSADEIVSEAPQGGGIGGTDHRRVDPAIMARVLALPGPVDILVSLRTPGPELAPIIERLQPALVVSYRCKELPQTSRFPDLDFRDHILTRWARLLAYVDAFPDLADLFMATETVSGDAGLTIVHPGAGSKARLWPAERWAAVVRALVQRGHVVRITGTASERSRCGLICAMADLPQSCNLAGRTPILALLSLVDRARCVVSVDSGIAHLATALRRPAVTLFGPVSPACWGPPPGTPRHATIWAGREGDTYGDTPDPGLLDIEPDRVIAAIDALLAEPAATRHAMSSH